MELVLLDWGDLAVTYSYEIAEDRCRGLGAVEIRVGNEQCC